MPESLNNLAGGFLQGFTGAKNQARQLGLMEEYRKAQTEHIKLEAKKQENALKLQELETPIYQAMAEEIQRRKAGSAPQTISSAQPFAQYQPASPQPIPDMIASAQTKSEFPFLKGPVNGLAPDLTTRLAAMGQEFFNITGQPLKITDGFRTTAQQADVYARKPKQALPPGSSEHERGRAVDVDTGQIPILEQTGLLEKHGFIRPALAGKNETWHLELGEKPQQQMSTPSTAPIQTAQPMQGGITGERLLEGWLKKKYGVEPEEVKYQKMGSHLWVLDKKGAVMGVYPGQGEYKMTEVKRPDGSVVTTPILTPPSPIPPGVPVFQMPGGGGGMGAPSAMFGHGIQTAPPEYNYEEISAPGGGKQKIPIPKAQAGGMVVPTEPPGIKIGDVGKTNLILHANDRLKEVNALLFPGGKLDRGILFKATAPMGGIGEGAKFYSKMYQTIDAALRLETGAQATPGEIQVKMREFWPNPQDTESVVREKSRDLNSYLTGLKQLHDPTGKISESKGVSIQIPSNLRNQKPKTWDELKKGLVGTQ